MKCTIFVVIVACLYQGIDCWCAIYSNPSPVPGKIFTPTHCEYKNETLELGETREINCLTVSCSRDGGVGVCDNYGYYGDFPERCKQIKDGCRYKLVLKSDETKDCQIQPNEMVSMVGR